MNIFSKKSHPTSNKPIEGVPDPAPSKGKYEKSKGRIDRSELLEKIKREQAEHDPEKHHKEAMKEISKSTSKPIKRR